MIAQKILLCFIGLTAGSMVAAGVFAFITLIGCQAVALAEALKVIPVFAKRIQLKVGLSLIILILAIGKGLGALWQLYFNWK